MAYATRPVMLVKKGSWKCGSGAAGSSLQRMGTQVIGRQSLPTNGSGRPHPSGVRGRDHA
eukprot:349906-Chlamydomonas_euryale.AAC.3